MQTTKKPEKLFGKKMFQELAPYIPPDHLGVARRAAGRKQFDLALSVVESWLGRAKAFKMSAKEIADDFERNGGQTVLAQALQALAAERLFREFFVEA